MIQRSVYRSALLCLPALFALLALAFLPLLRTVRDSLTNARLGLPEKARWIAFQNYVDLVRDPDWWLSVRNTAVFVSASVALETVFGLMIALLLHSRLKGRGALRTAVLIPWAIPAVISARIWSWMFNDLYGIINNVLLRTHLISHPIAWLADDRWSLVTLILVDTWKTTPFMALLILAGLQSIPSSVHEAAQVDGASAAREFFSVTFPLLAPALGVAVLFRVLDSIRIFDLPFILTSNSKASSVVSIFARRELVDFQDVGYGSASAFSIFCLTGIVAMLYLFSIKRQLGLER